MIKFVQPTNNNLYDLNRFNFGIINNKLYN